MKRDRNSCVGWEKNKIKPCLRSHLHLTQILEKLGSLSVLLLPGRSADWRILEKSYTSLFTFTPRFINALSLMYSNSTVHTWGCAPQAHADLFAKWQQRMLINAVKDRKRGGALSLSLKLVFHLPPQHWLHHCTHERRWKCTLTTLTILVLFAALQLYVLIRNV